MILFLCIGITAATENTTNNGDIEDLIDECENQGTVKLEEKTYELNPENETHLYLNKSISIEGTGNKTIIDGKHSTLYLDAEKEPEPDYNGTIVIARDIFDVRNTGGHIIFKNITFKDLNLISRHKMDFLDCKFINTNFTSKELDNNFDNCVFNESKIELNVYDTFRYNYYSKIINCTFYNSKITSKTNIFIEIVGSSRVFMQNGIDLVNSSLITSEILLSHYNINITDSKFKDSNLKGWSDIVNITNTSFINPAIDFEYSDVNFEQSILNNAELKFQAGYYAKGCKVVLKGGMFSNSTFRFDENFGLRHSDFAVQNSSVDECEIITSDTNIDVDNSTFNKSSIESFYSNLNINNTLFYFEGNISKVIKIKTEKGPYSIISNGTVSETYIHYQVNTNNTIENSYLINSSGKYKINNKDININTFYQITYNKNINYCIHENITFNVKDHNGKPVSNLNLFIENPNDNFTAMITTDENGNANYTLDHTGKLNFNLYYESPWHNLWSQRTSLNVNLTVYPKVIDLILKVFKFNKYSKSNSILTVKIICTNYDDLSGFKLIFKLYSGKKYKTYYRTVDASGIAIFKMPAKLNVGVHKIEVISNNVMKKTSVKINKASTTVKAPKITANFKKSKYFKVTIKNKETKKPLSNVKVKIKVFTGKKYKTYTVKTNKKGTAKINTKKLKTGKHKVIISSGNKNYKISAKSMITIKA